MASKSAGKKKQGTSAANPRSYSEIYKNSAATATSQPAATAASNASANGGSKAVAEVRKADAPVAALAGSDTVDWKGEYGYVLDDLKYLGIVTASLVGAIIVAGIFL